MLYILTCRNAVLQNRESERILNGMESMSVKTRPTGGKITEEVLNSTVHGLGAIAGIVGLIIGIITIQGSTRAMIGFIVYGVTLVILMVMSSLYHALYFSRAKKVFQKLDHSSILLLIAGSYTPFVLYLYSGWQLLLMLTLVWSIAVMGIVIKTAMPITAKRIGVGLYIGFGWLALLFAPRFSNLEGTVITLLITGGVLYTLGAAMMAFKKPFMHFGWHIMVVLAACMHFFAIVNLVQ